MATKKSSTKTLGDLPEKTARTVSFHHGGVDYSEAEANLQIDDMNVEQLRVYLNRAPARFAYWSSVKAQLNKDLSEARTNYELWFNEKYNKVCMLNEKATETFKKTQVLLDNTADYKKKQAELRELEYAYDQAGTLVKSYEMQSRTLQTIAALLRTEMELS